MTRRVLRIPVLLGVLALALVLGVAPGCKDGDEKGKKVEKAKKAEKKAEKPATVDPADPSREPVEDPSKLEERSRATVDPADPSREPVEDPSKLEERSRATVDPAEKPPEPTPADLLSEAMPPLAALDFGADAIFGGLAKADALIETAPDSPEAEKALVAALDARLAAVIHGGATPAFLDGFYKAEGQTPGATATLDYLTALEGKVAAREAAVKIEDAAVAAALAERKAILAFLKADAAVAAGRDTAPTITMPTSWFPPEEGAEIVEEMAFLPGAADPKKVLGFLDRKDTTGVLARYLVLSRFTAALAAPLPDGQVARQRALGARMGVLLCPVCPLLEEVPLHRVGEVLYHDPSFGFSCEGGCHDRFGLAHEDAGLLTMDSALALRLAAMLVMLHDTDAAGTPLEGEYAKLVAAAGEKGAKVGLAPPYAAPVPPAGDEKKKTEEAAPAELVLPVYTPGGADWAYQPMGFFTVDEAGVLDGLRPDMDVTSLPFAAGDLARGDRLPGAMVIAAADVQKEMDAKYAEAAGGEDKYKKLKKSGKWEPPTVKLVVKDGEWDKPDLSIPRVVEESKVLAGKADPVEAAVYPYLAGKGMLNKERDAWDKVEETVGRASLVYVDEQAPSLLLQRVLDSMFTGGRRDDRLAKGAGPLDSVPTVYFTEKLLADEALDTTYKRPILVYVTKGNQVRFYPPTNKTRKGKMTRKRSPHRRNTKWPGKFLSRTDDRIPDPLWNLFMAYTSADRKSWKAEVQGIANAMKDKWDNGNVFYIMAEEKAKAGVVTAVADLLAYMPGPAMPALDKAYPGFACDGEKESMSCPTNVVVLYPDVEIPYLPGKKRVKEVALNVYCDKKDIEKKIGAKRGAIKFCYDPELQKNPGLKGKISYKFTIGAAGKIIQLDVTGNSLKNGKVLGCVTRVLKKIRFRKPVGGQCVGKKSLSFKP